MMYCPTVAYPVPVSCYSYHCESSIYSFYLPFNISEPVSTLPSLSHTQNAFLFLLCNCDTLLFLQFYTLFIPPLFSSALTVIWHNWSTVHPSPHGMMHAPFMHQRCELAHCTFSGWGQLVSCCSIDVVCMSVALSSSLMNSLALPVGRPDVDQVTERQGM